MCRNHEIDITGIEVDHWAEAEKAKRGVVVMRKDVGLNFQHAVVQIFGTVASK